MASLAVGSAVVLFLLGALHFYWAIGGTWMTEVVVPTKLNGEKLFNPSAISCMIVGGGLWLMSVVYLANVGLFFNSRDLPILRYALFVTGIIFLLRSVGDFKWVGVFKRVKNTPFAKNDTRFYTPLCLLLSAASFVLFILQ